MQQSALSKMTIKWNLAYLMLERDIKTGDLASLTGLHPNTISKLKAQKEMPKRLDRETLDKICQGLGCQPGDLMVHTTEVIAKNRKQQKKES